MPRASSGWTGSSPGSSRATTSSARSPREAGETIDEGSGMRVAVLMGGTSDERTVSLSSGVEVSRALRESGHEVVAVDTARGVLGPREEQLLRAEGVRAEPPSAKELELLDPGET